MTMKIETTITKFRPLNWVGKEMTRRRVKEKRIRRKDQRHTGSKSDS